MYTNDLSQIRMEAEQARTRLIQADEVLIGRDGHPSILESGPTAMWFAMHIRQAIHAVDAILEECDCITPYLEERPPRRKEGVPIRCSECGHSYVYPRGTKCTCHRCGTAMEETA